MVPPIHDKGRLLRWLRRQQPRPWGTDPGVYDPEAVLRTLGKVNRWFGPRSYFRLSDEGWEHVPPAPVMVVSNHSGGTSIPDVWGLMVAWYRHFGVHRPLHPLAHEMVLGTNATGRYFSRRGVLAAHPSTGRSALVDFRRDVLVMPGGELEAWRPFRDRWRVSFNGRTGYARLALEAGVPVVPVANAGPHHTLVVLTDGRRIAKALRLPALARATIFPIHLSLPLGLTIGPWPHLPLPLHLRYRVGPAVMPPKRSTGTAPTEAEVLAFDQQVREGLQAALDDLRRKR